jgi:hypothetical protein
MPTNLRDWIIVLWPAFFAACLLEIAVFAAFDPADADLFGWGLALEPISIYSLAFLSFWAITAATGVVTWSLARGAPPVQSPPVPQAPLPQHAAPVRPVPPVPPPPA